MFRKAFFSTIFAIALCSQACGQFLSGVDNRINVVLGSSLNTANVTLVSSAGAPDFKGRRLFCLGSNAAQPPSIQFAFYNFRLNQTNGTPEGFSSPAADLVITKAWVNLLNNSSSLTPVGHGAPVTVGGNRSFTVPSSLAEFTTDSLTPAQFGVSSFAASQCFDYRHIYASSSFGQANYAPPSIIAQQGWRRGSSATLDDVDSTINMTCSPGCGAQTVSMPNAIIGPNPGGGFKSYGFFGDSITFRQNSAAASADAVLGAGYTRQAAFQAGVPYFTAGIGGRTISGTLLSTATLQALTSRNNRGFVALGTNDIAFATSLATMSSQLVTLNGILRPYFAKIGAANLPPRNTEGTSDATNAFAGTDLTVMVPYITQATVALGFPTAGYGFGPGETRDQWNATTLPGLLSGGTIDYIVDLASVTQDPTTTWKWAVPALNTTTTVATTVGGTTVVSVASPPLNTNLVLEPGNASTLEPLAAVQGGPVPYSVAGSGPFTSTVTYTNPYNSNTGQGQTIAKVHPIGSAMKGSNSTDYTHLATLPHNAARDLAAPLFTAN